MTETAWADSVPITNASFETLGGPLSNNCGIGCAFNTAAPTGWSVTGGGDGGSFEPGSYFSYIPNGSLVAFTNSDSISQTLTSSALANTLYTLTVYVGDRTNQVNGGFTIYLDTILGGVTTTLCSLSGNAANFTPGTWQAESCSYQSGANAPAGNFFLDLVSANGYQLDVDNVSLSDPPANVAEPSAMLLLGLGIVLVMGAALWNKQKALHLNA
jgi:hypothetical protein